MQKVDAYATTRKLVVDEMDKDEGERKNNYTSIYR